MTFNAHFHVLATVAVIHKRRHKESTLKCSVAYRDSRVCDILCLLGFRRPSAAKTLAGSSGGDQSGRINSSHSIIEELARSDWMGLSGGDQSGRKNSFLAHFRSFRAI